MRRSLILALVVLAALVCACSCSVATTWPQTFSLYADHNAIYTFDVVATGDIVVDANWTGCGLYVSLTDPAGNVVNQPPVLKASPAKVTYTVTSADLQKGKTWTVTIATPAAAAPSQQPVAEGNVTVKVPMPSSQILNPGVHTPGVDIHINTAVLPPSISSVTPDSGSANDIVKINGTNLPLDKNAADVWFTLGTNYWTRGTITNITKAASVVTYEVRVPGYDYAYNPFVGDLYIKIREGAQTNSLRFTYVPCKPPTITGQSTQYVKPGVRTTFTGTDIGQGDYVYFHHPTRGDIAALGTTYISSTSISAVMPADYPLDYKGTEVFVRYQCRGHWMNGPKHSVPIDPTAFNQKPK